MFTSHTRRARSKRRGREPRHALLLLVFAFMLLAPIGGQVATARQADELQRAQPTEEPDGGDQDDGGEEPEIIETEEPQPTEEPEIVETEEPMATEEPEGEQLGAIEIDYWECPATYDLTSPDLENLFMECEGEDGVQFVVQPAGGGSPQFQDTGEFGDSHVSFTELPTGPTQFMSENTTATAAVFCNGIVQHGGPETGYQNVPLSNGVANWNLQDDEIVFCSWLVQTTDASRIVIQKSICPAGYEPPQIVSMETIADDCGQRYEGVDFTVSDGGQYEQTDTSGPTGTVRFDDVPHVEVMISEDIPEGFAEPIVFCNTAPVARTPQDEANRPPYEIVAQENGGITYLVQPGHEVACSFFNIPEEDMATEPVTEEPTEMPTEEGSEEPTGDLVGAFEIEYRECPDGYTFLDAMDEDELDQMLQECAQVDGVEFTIDQGGPDGNTQETGEFGESHISFTEVPTGMRTVTQTDAFAITYVVCEGIVSNGGPETGDMEMTVSGGSIQWDLIDEEIVYCDWFVMAQGGTSTEEPTEPVGELVGAIEIEYRECADGYTFLDAMDEDQLDQMLQECDQVNDVEFTIDQGGPDGNSQLTGFYGDSHVSFLEVPTGMRTVTQTVPSANTYVTCQGIVSNGGPETGLMEMTVSNGSIQWNLIDEEIVYCDWFVMGDGGVIEPENEQVGSLNINYWECPATIDFATISDDGLATECTDSRNGVVFGVTNGTFSETQSTGDINDGVVAFGEVPTGTVSVKQLTPPQQLIVICQGIVSNGGPETAIMRMPITQATIEWNLLDDEVVYCDWYVIPLVEGVAQVAINKHACPEGFDAYNADIYELAANCHEDPGTVAFNVTSGAYNQDANATGGGNYAEFADVPTGSIAVTEDVPDGYAEPIVYCKIQAYPSLDDVVPTHRVQLNGGNSFTRVVGDSQLLWCDVFNVLEDHSTVTVNKFHCPEGTGYEEDDAWYQENCTEYHEGVQFKLTHDDGDVFGITDGNGQVMWDGVPMGPFSIQEYIPGGYGDPVVICGMTAMVNGAIADGFPRRVEAPGGYLEAEIGLPNTDYFCFWYNIPAGPGEITIFKYICPEGYDVDAWDADPTEDCTEGTNGVTFTLNGMGYASQSDTGDRVQYAVYFGGLEPGPYTVTESVPVNTQYAFVWDCYGQRMGELRPTPLSMGDTLDIDVGAGESISCYWYNVPRFDPEYGRITVYKYECGTATFVSEVDCERYEGGQEFDLVWWNGDAWEYADTRTTDGAGKILWINVPPGEYWLDEQGADWCHMTSEQLSDDGNWLNVYDDQETVVKVFNCTSEPGKPGKTPTKYPNTGIPTREEWRLTA